MEDDGPSPPASRRSRRRPDAAEIARLLASPRCGARTRAGPPCAAPAVRGQARCRKHGGAAGSGAQAGNRNALQDGFYSRTAKARRRAIMDLMRACNRTSAEVQREHKR